jgi:hypothetical protein
MDDLKKAILEDELMKQGDISPQPQPQPQPQNPQFLLDSLTEAPTVVPTLEGLKETMERVYS